MYTYTWGLCCQKQVSQAGISNYIPQFTVGCSYLSQPEIPVSCNKVLISHVAYRHWEVKFHVKKFRRIPGFDFQSVIRKNKHRNQTLTTYHYAIFFTTSGFPLPIGVNAENASMPWRHHAHRPYQAKRIQEGTNSMKTTMLSSSYWYPVEFQNGTPILSDTGAMINLLSTRICGLDFKYVLSHSSIFLLSSALQFYHILPLDELCWTLGTARQQAIPRTNADLDLCRHIASLGHNESTVLVPPDFAAFGQLFWMPFPIKGTLSKIFFEPVMSLMEYHR